MLDDVIACYYGLISVDDRVSGLLFSFLDWASSRRAFCPCIFFFSLSLRV